MPAASWPSTAGVGCGHRPSTKWRSLWHTPVATVRTSTSCSRGSSIWISSMLSGLPGPWKTAAFISSLLLFSVEHQNRAGDLAGLHRAEGLVDVGQLATPRD